MKDSYSSQEEFNEAWQKEKDFNNEQDMLASLSAQAEYEENNK